VFKILRRGNQDLDLKLFINKKSALVIATSITIVIGLVVIAMLILQELIVSPFLLLILIC
jgi:hypothetical protein